MANYEKFELGAMDNLHTYELKHPAFAKPVHGKVFLGPRLKLTGMECSMNKLRPGGGVPFLHKHRTHEELYVFFKGRGQFQVDGEVIEIQEGTALRVDPVAARAWRNNSTEDLYYFVVQARAGTMNDGPIGDGELVKEPLSWP